MPFPYDQGGVMVLSLGDVAPDFTQDSTLSPNSKLNFYSYLGRSWGLLFSHPADFTPVCTTELGQVARLWPEFEKRNTKVLGLSVNGLDEHELWIKDIEETQRAKVLFPIIADRDSSVARLFGMLDQPGHDSGNVNPATGAPLTVRSVFIIDPSRKTRLILTYPAAVGRNFDEILRALDALQLTDRHKVATPANWFPGDDVIIRSDVADEEAQSLFPGFETVKPYLRYTSL